MSTGNRDFSNLPRGPVRVPLPNEFFFIKSCKIPKIFILTPLIFIPNDQFVD